MRWRPLLWHGSKWAMTLLTAAVTLLWGVSLRRAIGWQSGSKMQLVDVCGYGVLIAWAPRETGYYEEALTSSLHLTKVRYEIMHKDVEWRYKVWWPRRPTWVLPAIQGYELPLWLPLAASALPAVGLWWPQVRARLRRRAGHCGKCGYDRRGIPAEALCPECGTLSRR